MRRHTPRQPFLRRHAGGRREGFDRRPVEDDRCLDFARRGEPHAPVDPGGDVWKLDRQGCTPKIGLQRSCGVSQRSAPRGEIGAGEFSRETECSRLTDDPALSLGHAGKRS